MLSRDTFVERHALDITLLAMRAGHATPPPLVFVLAPSWRLSPRMTAAMGMLRFSAIFRRDHRQPSPPFPHHHFISLKARIVPRTSRPGFLDERRARLMRYASLLTRARRSHATNAFADIAASRH